MVVVVVVCCPVHCKIFNSIPGLSLPVAPTLPVMTIKNVTDFADYSVGEERQKFWGKNY